ncbi:unnamed protein product [Lymnaea stagnalis]|uniref:OTU domain-containing protein n=1 Tax=Lymnaea stagnalis TaxID=6523 RepID=A0AAV2HFK8_LYMST
MDSTGSGSPVLTESKDETQKGDEDVARAVAEDGLACRGGGMPAGVVTGKGDRLHIKTLVHESVRLRESKCPNCGLPKSHKRTRLNYSRFACPCDVDVGVRGEEAREDISRYGVDNTLKPSGDIACCGDCDQSMWVDDPTPIVSLLKDGPPEETPVPSQKEEVFENGVGSVEAVDGVVSSNTNNSAIGPEKGRMDNLFTGPQLLASSAAAQGVGRVRNAHLSGCHSVTRRTQSTVPVLSGNSPIGSVGRRTSEIFLNPPKSQKMQSNFKSATNKNNCYRDPSKQGMECVCVSRNSNTGFRLHSAIVRPVPPMPKKSFLCRPALGVHAIEIRFQNADRACIASSIPKDDTSSSGSSVASSLSNKNQSLQHAYGSSKTGSYGPAHHQRNTTFIGPSKRINTTKVEPTVIVGNLRTYDHALGERRGFSVRKARQAISADNNVKQKNGTLTRTPSSVVKANHPYFSFAPPDVIATRGRVGCESQQFTRLSVGACSGVTTGDKTSARSGNDLVKKCLDQMSYSSPNEIYGLGDSFSSERNNSNGATSHREDSFIRQQFVGRVVRVEGDGRCLFRSLVTAGCPKLQTSRRDEFGRPERLNDADEETVKADELRALVVRLMKDNLHFYSQLEKGVINADQPVTGNYQKFHDRLEAMSNNHTMPGELELNAAAMVLERMIFVLNTDLVLITTYGQDRYPQSKPLAVRFTRLGPDVGHYDAVVLADEEPGQNSHPRTMGTCLKDTVLSACEQLSKLSLRDGKDSNNDGSTACDTCPNQTSDNPDMRSSPTHKDMGNDPDMCSSPTHKDMSNAPDMCSSPKPKDISNAPDMCSSPTHKDMSNDSEVRYWSCHKQTSHAPDVRYSPRQKQTRNASNVRYSSCHKQTSDAPEVRYSCCRQQTSDASEVRYSPSSKQTSDAPEVRYSCCHQQTSDAPEVRYSCCHQQTSDASGVRYSSCHQQIGDALEVRYSSCHPQTSDAPEVRYSSCHPQNSDAPEVRCPPAGPFECNQTSRSPVLGRIEMNRGVDLPTPGNTRETLPPCTSNNNKGLFARRRKARRKYTHVGTRASRVVFKRENTSRYKARRVHVCGLLSSGGRSNSATYAIVPQCKWTTKRDGQDKNYNSRSGVRKRRDRSRSDSDSSPERKKKYRKFSPSTSGKKKPPGRQRGGSSKESRYCRTDSTPGTSKDKGKQAVVKRKPVKRSKSVRSSNSSDTNVNPDVEVQPPKPPRLPEAFTFGQCQCLLCRKIVVMTSASSSWLKCYLCGRVAHRECVVKHSPAWGRGKDDDIYFLCNDCVPE